jgi:competence protein ComEC
VNYSWQRLYFTVKLEQLRYKSSDFQAFGSIALVAGYPSNNAEAEYGQLELRHGARVRTLTMLRRVDSFRNPGVSPFTEYLDRKGYEATGFIKSPLLIERLDDAPVFLPLSFIYEWRTTLQRQIDGQFSPETAGVLDAALLGNRYNLRPSTSDRFREGGTFHVLVISGLHITFIGGLVLLIMKRITKRRGIQVILSAVVLWSYTLAVGAEASVVRAALMFTLIALGPVLFRQTSALNALGGAALVLTVWRPKNLFDPSFQLTFLSVLAIVALAWPLMQRLSAIGSWRPNRASPYPPTGPRWLISFSESLFWREQDWEKEMVGSVYRCRLIKSSVAWRLEHYHLQRPARYVLGAVVVSAMVQIVLLPFLVIYFHRLSFASLVLNIAVSLNMAVLSLVSLAALFVAQLSASAAIPLTNLANGLNWLMVHSVDPFSHFGLASMRLPHYSGAGRGIYVVYYLPMVALAVALHRWNPLSLTKKKSRLARQSYLLAASQILLLVVIILHPLSAGSATGKLQIDFLDVGQGDAALITAPDGTTLLIDGGGRPSFTSHRSNTEEDQFGHEARSVGEAVVSEYLWWRGLDTVDYVLATHAHADHMDGLNDVVRNFRVRSALVARAPKSDPEFQKFAGQLLTVGVPFTLIGGGDVLRFGSVKATVLWPPLSSSQNAASGNNDSVALRLDFGNNSSLLTGDIESEAEKVIIERGENLRADVVKVAHHGSKTSSTLPFVLRVSPAIAVISVGQTSIFDHPNRGVIESWTSAGAEVLTTGKSGTITITMDGRNFYLRSLVKE